MTSIKKQNALLIIKVLALMSIVRWMNIALTISAQYLAAVFVLNQGKPVSEVLLNPKLHLMTLASAFIIAGGYIINNFYDFEKDLVNRPEKTLLGRLVSRKFGLNCYFLFNFTGLCLALIASWRIFLYYLIFTIALWAYSHKFQKIPFVRESIASVLSVASFFSIGIFYKYITMPLFLYGCFAMLTIFSREILKGIEAYKGNAIFGYGTLASKMGKNKSTYFMILIQLTSLIPLIILWLKFGMVNLGPFLIGLTLLICLLLPAMLLNNDNMKKVSLLHGLYKIFLVTIIFLVVFIPENLP
ncbi:MAG: geranylgeranylglycerol-phosphate geranylgeranyltransferase [Flavobacteriales bacterium]|nr:geranylgeranylglycerol-phosphate geranylgeranyltransferase [Flavobacteriales bacterium]